MSNAEVAVAIQIGGAKRVVGKILQVGDKRVFYRRYRFETALLRKTDSFSFDKRVLDLLDGVDEVHYEDESGALYVVPLEHLVEHAVPDNYGEGTQLYLPRTHWTLTSRDYAVGWTDAVITVQELTNVPHE